MLKRIFSLSIKELIHLRRDWLMPAFMLFGGLLELLLVGWATSRPITNLPIMALDQDQSAASRDVLAALENTTTFDSPTYANSLEEIKESLKRDRINAAVVIPPDYGEAVASHDGNPTLVVYLNGAQSMAATAALRSIEGLTRDMGEEITLRRLNMEPGVFEGLNPSVRVWFNEALSEAWYTTPAELALMLEFTVLIFAAIAFSRERELGTLEQLLVMPFSELEIIIGKSLPAIFIGFVDFSLMLGIVHFAFQVPVRGSLFLLLLLAAGYVTVELSKGLVVSVLSKTQHQAFLGVFLWGMIDFMFTGYAIPVESMPSLMQTLSNLIPAYHWLAIVRGILLKGVGLEVLWPHVLWLAGLGIVIITLSVQFVRRALK